LVVEVVVAAARCGGVADDGEGGAVDGDRLADQRVAGKEQMSGLEAEHGDAAALGNIGGVNEAAFLHLDEAHIGEIGLDACDLRGSVGPRADLVEILPIEDGGDGAQFGQLAHVRFILRGELIGTHGGVLVGQRGDGGVEHHDDVVADAGQVAPLATAKAFAQTDQNEQRTDSPGNAEHGEEGAQLVGHHGPEDFTENVAKTLHKRTRTRLGKARL
jgi:hypothetical protein